MVGFLAAGVLAGLISLGWPIYLHLRRRQKPAVQTIPSLRLFSKTKRLTRFSLLERILLLLARVLFLVFLCILLAQPYIETERDLSLPRIDEQPADCRVGFLLDDSLTALHGPSARTRLDMSAAWFREQIRNLPGRSRVTIALTSFPYPTRPMSRGRASELLGRLKPIPRAGKATKALVRLHDLLRGKKGAIVVAAPRDGALWEDLSEGTDLEHAATVYFLDTTDRRLPWFIQSVEPASPSQGNDGGDGWILNLLGDPEAMVDEELVADGRGASGSSGKPDRSGRDGRVRRYRITPGDARRGRASLLLPRGAPPCWYAVSVASSGPSAGGGDAHGRRPSGPAARVAPPGERTARVRGRDVHPWRRWYFRGEREGARGKVGGAAVVRPRTREGFVADKIVTAALQSVYPESAIHHIDPREPPAGLPAAGAVVCVGTMPSGARLLSWLRECLEDGGRVLCLPTEGPASYGTPAEAQVPGFLPVWGSPLLVSPEAVSPLKMGNVRPDAGPGLDEFLVSGLSQVRYTRLREPRFVERGEVLIVTRDDRPFLAARRVGENGQVWALAAPLSLASGSIVYHPSFPLLVRRALFERAKIAQTALQRVEVGQTIDLLKWFAVRTLEGTVTFPDGTPWQVQSPTGLPVRIDVSLAGPHFLKTRDSNRVRLANYPRLKRDTTFTRDDWTRRRPNTNTVWMAASDALPQDLGFIGEDPNRDKPRRYDLTPLAAPLVAAFLAMEAALLVYHWWRRATPGRPDVQEPRHV